ncbi:MAG: hypothetical protein OXU76_06215, partial [Alphaproteobacteria bacterium]|nr:hypothetical protein [Alphaproteobacteria bacterium]
MTEQEDRNLIFSQRGNHEPRPSPPEPESLTDDFRIWVWKVVDNSYNLNYEDFHAEYYLLPPNDKFWENFIVSYQMKILKKPHDECMRIDEFHEYLKSTILKDNFKVVLNLIEFLLRELQTENTFGVQPNLTEIEKKLKSCFSQEPVAYTID